jgi:succinoglycan biosynthesis protein ExoO
MPGTGPPSVTVAIANFNGERFIESALRTVLAQSVRDIEVVIADDASTDNSLARVRSIAAGDSRVRVLQAAVNGGPAAARNMVVEAARGEWIAVLDSDDLMHPDRLARLLAVGRRERADIVADNLLIFDDAGATPPFYALSGKKWTEPVWVTMEQYVDANLIGGRHPALGYLKPMFRADFIRDSGLRYDPSLRIAEDYDFVLRLLQAGARFRVVPEATYFYRKHRHSISHRLTRKTLEPMLAADEAFRAVCRWRNQSVTQALDRRRASIERAIAFDDLVVALKSRRLARAAATVVRRPDMLPLLRWPLAGVVSRLVAAPPRRAPAPTGSPSACVISRQRVVGATNGSSVYLLSLCDALRKRGVEAHLVCPSPATFGRWPAMRLAPEMRVFSSVAIRGSWRVGPIFIARDPRVLGVALQTVADRLLVRFGLRRQPRVKPAPYAIAVPWTAEDFLFLARHARARADMLIADYAFLTDGFPYALRPDAPTAVVMHDLFCRRSEQFARLGSMDSVAMLDETTEMRLLSQADVVVAIQPEEAEVVRRHLPGRRVIVAPMAVNPVAAPQPGEAHEVLFVGSGTAPNVQGLRWFLDEIWPAVRAAEPRAVLSVAGNVGRAVGPVPEGVRLLGRLADLAPVYTRAAVVVSPLRAGSGLKIKLVEALAHGKASVVTPVTMQGVEDVTARAVEVASDAATFAAAVSGLLADPERRRALGQAALEVARAAFSPEACHAELAAFLVGAARPAHGTSGGP